LENQDRIKRVICKDPVEFSRKMNEQMEKEED